METLGEISELYIYPIKSCAGIKVTKALVTTHGLAHVDNPNVIDRKWMIIDENNNFITQRKAPKMALISLKVEKDFLILTAPKMNEMRVPIEVGEIASKRKSCRCWSNNIDGYSYGGEVAMWLSKYLEMENVDLVVFDRLFQARKVCEEESKSFNTKSNDEVIYADCSALMILSQASIDEINTRLVDNDKVSVRNFRPNILVGECQAFDEDKWINFKVNDIYLRTIKHCTRCLLTTVNPDLGIKYEHQEPLKTLRSYRMNKEIYGPSPMFGINVGVEILGENRLLTIGNRFLSI